MSADKRKYVTCDQKSHLVDFIRSHNKMIKQKFDETFSVKECNSLWEQLACILNNLEGARKSTRGWRKCWHDLRRNTREKVAKLRQQGFEDLTPIQEKVIALIEGQDNNQETHVYNIKQEDNNFFTPEKFNCFTGLNCDDKQKQLSHEILPIKIEESSRDKTPEKYTPKRYTICRRKRLKSIAEKKLIMKKSYYDRKLALLEKHIAAINRQTEAINKQTEVHERLMQLLSRK